MSADRSLEAYLDVEERDSAKTARVLDSGNLARLIRSILAHRAPLAGGLVMVFAGTFAALLEPRLFGYAIDEAVIPGKASRLVDLAILFLLVVCVRVAAAISQAYLFEVLGQRVTQDLRNSLFSQLLRLPVSVYDKTPAGKLLTRVTNDIASLGEMFSAGFVSIISNALMVLGILAWLVALDLKLGLIAASVFPIMMAIGVYFSMKLKVSYREARSKLSALNAFLAENILGMKVVHLFNRQRLHLERFDRVNQWYTDAQIGTVRIFAFFQPSITLAAGLSMALVIWFGGSAALQGSIQVGVLVAYFSYVLSLFQPVRELADKWNVFLSGMASAERIYSVLDWATELTREEAGAPAERIEGLRGHIVFENVWFAYEGEHWVLKDFSFEILPGQRVGVVGHTGAGKTTLISLLMRFYEPQRGRILIDGRDIREYDKRSLRASVGIVQQDVFVFSGTFEENVTFWGAEGGRRIEERGSNLSMGEKQLLAFSRAKATQPRIWILDEATANMDSETEAGLQASLDEASSGRTTILIAHRLATVRFADRIAVLHKGVLVEQGRHEELVSLDGLYARLYRYQQAQDEPEAPAAALQEPGTETSAGAPA